jgi:dipeptidyl aminopeptidase/acylaminoacyl peptidase
MHEDVTDAVKALVAAGRVDPARICIVGASYGGYEALWAAHAEPELYKCAIDVDGVSDLKTALNWERRFGADSDGYKYWVKAIGDPKTDADRLAAISPVTYAKTWTTPLLLIHGDKDEVVDVAQSRIMKRALDAQHKPVRYIEIKQMGHGPQTDAETTQVLTEMDSFLAQYLRPEPAPSPAAAPTPAPAKAAGAR